MKTKTALPLLAIVLIAITLALSSSGCGEKLTLEKELTEEKELTVEEIAEQIRQKDGNIEDYSCTIHLNLFLEGEALEREFEVLCKKPDMYRIFTKTPGKEPEKVEVSDGKYMWTYYTWKNTAIKVKLPETPGPETSKLEEKELSDEESEENSGAGFIEWLSNEKGVFLLGTEEIGGRPAYLLGKNPEEKVEEEIGKDEGEEREEQIGEEDGDGEEDVEKEGALPVYREKFWIDKETGTLLRYETYDRSENLTVKFEIRDLEINKGIPDYEFEFEVPEGVTVETREFGKYYPPENMTAPDGDRQIASGLIMGFCP